MRRALVKMPRFVLYTIPHECQRYPTVGDWEGPVPVSTGHNVLVCVSAMGDADYEFCVALHELVESYLCIKANITDAQVTKFDKAFEKARGEGNTDEPGDDPRAPYRREHFFATTIERLMAAELGIDWKAYEEKINSL
jgi:hypothetical protein